MRRIFPSLILITGLFLFFSGLSAQAPQRSGEALVVLQQSLQAVGGIFSASASSDITITASFQALIGPDQLTKEIHITATPGQELKVEISTPDNSIATSVTESTGTVQSGDAIHGMHPGNSFGLGPALFPHLLMANILASPDIAVIFEDDAEVNGSTVYRIFITRLPDKFPGLDEILRHKTRYELFINKTTLLPVRVRNYVQGQDWRVDFPIDLDFQDYRNVGGLLFPHLIERRFGQHIIHRIEVQTVGFAPSASASLTEGGIL